MSLAITHPQNTGPDTSQLEALARHALEPNIFHEAALLQPALTHLAPDTLKLCTSIDTHTGAPTGALPVTRAKGRYGPLSIVPTPIIGWQHPYAMVGTPLLDRAHGEAALNDLFDTIAGQFSGAKVLLLRHLRTDGPLWPLMKAVMDHSDRRYTILETYDRAGLDVTDPGQTTLRKLIGKKSASSIRASRRKLGELGTVRHEVAQDGQTVSKALETFLHLEASGWKGRAGTALLNAGAGHAAFVREAVTQLAVAQRVRIDSLSLDGEPVAGTLSIRDGSKAAPNWMPWKTAYNERFTDYGPGSLILHDLTDSLLHEATQAGTPLLLDSLAVSDSVIANRLWRHRWSFADILIDLSPSGSAAFGPIRMAERARAAARQIAKRTAKPAKHHLTSRGQDKQS